jgi:hypothetical protein
LIDPLPDGANRGGAVFPDGGHITDLKQVREILYAMQRPAIAPSVSHSIINSWGSPRLFLFSSAGISS